MISGNFSTRQKKNELVCFVVCARFSTLVSNETRFLHSAEKINEFILWFALVLVPLDKLLTLGKLQINLHFLSFIRNFAA